MSKGALSKEFIIEKSMVVFNTKGYTGTSMQDIIDNTGFTKGGVYRHFENKEALAIAAFEMAYNKMQQAYSLSFSTNAAADVKLVQFLNNLKIFMLKPPVKGGCPILNSATEVDDTNEPLRVIVKAAAKDWEQKMVDLFNDGIKAKIFAKKLNAIKEARFFIAAIEGSIMLCKLHRNPEYGLYTADILLDRVATLKQ